MMGIEVTSTVAYVPTAPVRVVDSVGKVPSEFEFVAELPKSQVGKVLRRALKS